MRKRGNIFDAELARAKENYEKIAKASLYCSSRCTVVLLAKVRNRGAGTSTRVKTVHNRTFEERTDVVAVFNLKDVSKKLGIRV